MINIVGDDIEQRPKQPVRGDATDRTHTKTTIYSSDTSQQWFRSISIGTCIVCERGITGLKTVGYLVSDDEVFPTVRDIGRQPVPAAGLLFSPLAPIGKYRSPR
jgi:hypothetical protein